MSNVLKVNIDGACQPNPGQGGIGAYFVINDKAESYSLPLDGIVTNNIAEYEALIFSLEKIISRNDVVDQVIVFSDSQLVCMQFNGKWKCKVDKLSLLLKKAKELKMKIDCKFQLTYIPREKNEIADELAKNAISYKIQYFLQEKKKKK